jgi:hypothetical protein
MNRTLIAAIAVLGIMHAGCESREDNLEGLRAQEAGFQIDLRTMERTERIGLCDHHPDGTRTCRWMQDVQDSLLIVQRRIDRLLH